MGVNVHGGGKLAVAEPLTDLYLIHVQVGQHGCMGVPKLVHSERPEFVYLQELPEPNRYHLRIKRCSKIILEYGAAFDPLRPDQYPPLVLLQFELLQKRNALLGDGDISFALGCLWCIFIDSESLIIHPGLNNGHNPFIKIYVIPI